MVGVGYGKGHHLPEAEVRWLTPEEMEERQRRGLQLRFFDARDEKEYEEGTLPGAELLSQTMSHPPEDLVVALHDVRMLARAAQDTVDAETLTESLAIVEGKAALLVDDERVRRAPDLYPRLVERRAQLLLGPTVQVSYNSTA